jgi:hypothetical protein
MAAAAILGLGTAAARGQMAAAVGMAMIAVLVAGRARGRIARRRRRAGSRRAYGVLRRRCARRVWGLRTAVQERKRPREDARLESRVGLTWGARWQAAESDAIGILSRAHAGREAEERVDQCLRAELGEEWFISAGFYPESPGGDVDHLAIGPTGAYAIETKHSSYRATHLAQAARNARRVELLFGWAATPVVAVLCIAHGDFDVGETRVAGRSVYIVPAHVLARWMRRGAGARSRGLSAGAA